MDGITQGAAPTFAWEVVADGDATTVGDLGLAVRPHRPPGRDAGGAGRARRPRRSCYSADTGPAWSFAAASGRRVDLALVRGDARPRTTRSGVHLTGGQAGALAREAGAEHLLLTHLVPGTDPARRRSEAEATYEGPVSMAAPGDTYEV